MQQKKGFTIIEVVLVLAIAGLIFLMVFIALPALQRGQKDQQRANDLSRLQTALTKYQTNNRNKIPGDSSNMTPWNSFVTRYVKVGDDTFADPNGEDYTLTASNPEATFVPSPRNVQVSVGSVCDGENLKTGQGASKVSFRMKLEGGGIACVNN